MLSRCSRTREERAKVGCVGCSRLLVKRRGLGISESRYFEHPVVREHACDEEQEAAKLRESQKMRTMGAVWQQRHCLACIGLYLVQVSP